MTRPDFKKASAKVWNWFAAIGLAIWLALQFGMIGLYYDNTLSGDPGSHIELAENVLLTHHPYPDNDQITHVNAWQHRSYIIYPGYINLLAVVMAVFGSYKAMFFINVAFNLLLLWSLHRVTRTLFGLATARWACVLYCLFPWSIWVPCVLLTELPSLAFTGLALALLTYRNKWLWVFAGVSLILSYYIRPSALVFGVAALIMLLTHREWLKILWTAGGTAASACVLLLFNWGTSGVPFITSNTLGINVFI